MKERDFQNWVVQVARRFHWKVWHVPAPMRATRTGTWVGAREGAGLPDLILIHDDPPRLIFAELKGTKGVLTAEQREFLQAAKKVADLIGEPATIGLNARQWALGVYAWQPGMEQPIENLLRSRVLT